ncbi:MAG: CpXC domain-containing protein [bacterium]|nr:CpXC domain-containing protein [Myxococcales bacterium]
MSTFLPASIACPRCGEAFQSEIAISVHAERMPELRHALLDDRFQQFTCPSCLFPVRVEPSLLYTDFGRDLWVVALRRDGIRHRGALAASVQAQFDRHMRENCAPMVRAWADDFTVRLVFGTEALREKLVLFDAGLDDRLVEALKWDLARRESLLAPDALFVVRAVDDATVHLLHRSSPDEARGTVLAVPRALLDAYAAEREQWAAALPSIFDGIVVDWRAPLWPDEPLPDAESGPLPPADH